jgi:CheY-like chemotaxis protein
VTPPPRKVLVVDDDPQLRQVIRLVLEDEGFVVALATDGREAVESVERLRPAMIVLDMLLPRLDGAGVAEALRRAHDDGLQIVLMSGSDGAEAVARRCGANGFLRKPFDLDALLAAVRRCAPPVVAGGAPLPGVDMARFTRDDLPALYERTKWRHAALARAKSRLAELRASTRADRPGGLTGATDGGSQPEE